MMSAKTCTSCAAKMDPLAVFPGGICLGCHEKKFDAELARTGVLPRPDFVAAIGQRAKVAARPVLVARWEANKGKRWIDLFRSAAPGRYFYQGDECSGGCAAKTDDEAIAYLTGRHGAVTVGSVGRRPLVRVSIVQDFAAISAQISGQRWSEQGADGNPMRRRKK